MLVSDWSYRIGINIASRAMRSMMRAKGVPGVFSVGTNVTFYEHQGIRLIYDYSRFGVAGNIDSGGTTEEATRAKLGEILNGCRVFYDIGAHEGLFSIDVKKRAPATLVYAFEPQAKVLFKNLSLNNIHDVRIHQTAVGQCSGIVHMTTNRRSSNHILASGVSAENVFPVATIDSLVTDGFEPPDIMKLDIEGYEFQALIGARNTLLNHQPLIITEINHCFLRYHNGLLEFINYMTKMGYEIRCLQKGTLVRCTAVDDLASLLPSDDSNYWWVSPRWAAAV